MLPLHLLAPIAAAAAASTGHPALGVRAAMVSASGFRHAARSYPVLALEVEEKQAPPTTPAVNPRSQGLALALDDGTRKSHSVAENTAFVTGFFRGIATRDAFSQLVAGLYFVYAAMEAEFDASEDPRVKALDFPDLRRTAALEEDMRFYFGDQFKATVRPSPATALYVARVREVARSRPELLVAHMYTRYLGDLFGGQMMGGMARRSLGLSEDEGLRFYTFDAIDDVSTFIDTWYTAANALGLSPELEAEVVDEANRVFSLNIALFDELDGKAWRALWALFTRALVDWDKKFKPAHES
mmetsp:Transcript_16547/g.44603  ORF Transcript_16547/g.44603 Transcript_16547/m.44603 type:complete len:299 (-) Transcript_16547:129-1025(-)|eukprot:CAMPEP_0185187160 /NCGR_PEP_ID=MMETSP1140-20130426/4550_1 /TAXON_ID=298111 /ORGANISM="Pavlova sp., Strain CCMP459" /LENGTH=298 /DNA_ID=CAMNT_0027753519 /DNA_START=31 /DNA_END=927 /DNA_ORIENTATION=-